MSDERWVFIVVMLFSPIGWIFMAIAMAGIGFVFEMMTEIFLGNKFKKKRDGKY